MRENKIEISVMNISDLWPLSARELGAINGDGMAYRMLEKIEAFLYKRSKFCMGQSQEIVNYINTHGAKEVYLFRNGVDPKRFAEVERDFSINDRPFRLTYAGLLGFAQGISDICKNINFKEIKNNTSKSEKNKQPFNFLIFYILL